MLRVVLPKGSLERATLQLFEDADLAVVRSSDVDYRAGIDDPRVIDVTILRPQEIPRYVADGLFDLGVTGRDWIEETGVDVVTSPSSTIEGSRTSVPDRARIGGFEMGIPEGSPVGVRADRISRAHPALPRARGRRRHLVVVRRPGPRSPRSPTWSSTAPRAAGRCAAGLKVLDTVLVSYTELIASPISHRCEQAQGDGTAANLAHGRSKRAVVCS